MSSFTIIAMDGNLLMSTLNPKKLISLAMKYVMTSLLTLLWT